MIIRPIDKIIEKTADKLSVDKKIVEYVIKYYYHWVYLRLNDFRRPTISIPNIGTFYPAKVNFNYALTTWLGYLKKDPNREFYKKHFRSLWNVRHKVKEYYKMKKTKVRKKI